MSYPYNKSFYKPEHEIFRDSFRRFIAEEMDPQIEVWEQSRGVPQEWWKVPGKAGMLCVDIPEEFGGGGGDFLHRVLVAEELGYSAAGATMAPAFIADNISEHILHHGTEEQRRTLIPAMAAGELRIAFAITEPDNGSDIARLRTNAVREGDEFVINGAKTYISGAISANLIFVACKTDPAAGNKGISVIMVEADRAGFKRGRKLHKMGSHGSDTGELFFDNVRVPVSNLFGPLNGGFKVLMHGLTWDRFLWPTIAHAAATRAFHETVSFVKNRKAFGQNVIDFQNTQFRLAEIKTELAIGRAFLDDCIRDYIANGKFDIERCTMAKLWFPEMEGQIIDQCVQLHGGAGYMDEYLVSRLYTTARLHRIFAGTGEIMRVIIGRSI